MAEGSRVGQGDENKDKDSVMTQQDDVVVIDKSDEVVDGQGDTTKG